MSPGRGVQEPEGGALLSLVALRHQCSLPLLTALEGPREVAGAVKLPQLRLPHSSPTPSLHSPTTLLPSPSLSYREGGSKSLAAEAHVTPAWGPQTVPKVWQGREHGPRKQTLSRGG